MIMHQVIPRLFGLLLLLSPAAAQTPTAAGQTEPRARSRAYVRYLEAQRHKSARRLEEAIAAFEETIRLDPTAAEPHVDLGELYFFYQSRRDLAEREALEAVRLSPSSVSAHVLLARLYMAAVHLEKEPGAAQLDRAVRSYEKVTQLDAAHAESWALLAELYRRKGDTARQIQSLERWTGARVPGETFFYRWLTNNDLTPDQAYYQLSLLYLEEGQGRQAVEAARRAFELDPDSQVFSRNLVSVLRMAGSSEEELKTYEQLSRTSDNPALRIGYGAALVRVGRYPEAIERMRDYVRADPSNASAVRLLAVAERRGGERPAAVETLKAGLERADAGSRRSLTLDLGETYEELGRNDDAVAQYEQVYDGLAQKSALTPQTVELFNHVVTQLARVYRRTGAQLKLQGLFTRTRPLLGDGNPLLDVITIETLREDGRPREALELARAAGRRFPEDRSLKFAEALILGEMKNSRESVDLLRGMLKGADPEAVENATVYMIMSSVQMQVGQLREAEASVRRALEINPRDGDLLIQLSSVQDRGGRPEEAERTLREVLAREPDHATALNNLGYLMVERGGRYEEALRLIERAVNIEPINGSFLDSLGWANYKLGRLKEARAQFERALAYARRNPTLHEHFGDVLRDLGQLQEARRQWEKALEYAVEADETARLKEKLKKF